METPSTPFTSGCFFAWIEHLTVNFIPNVAGFCVVFLFVCFTVSWDLVVKRHEFSLGRDSRILSISRPPSAILPTLHDTGVGVWSDPQEAAPQWRGSPSGKLPPVMAAKCSFSTDRACSMQHFTIKFTYKFSVNKIVFYT